MRLKILFVSTVIKMSAELLGGGIRMVDAGNENERSTKLSVNVVNCENEKLNEKRNNKNNDLNRIFSIVEIIQVQNLLA